MFVYKHQIETFNIFLLSVEKLYINTFILLSQWGLFKEFVK